MSTVMHRDIVDRFVETENESEAARLECRWFAAYKHAEALRVECEILREVMEVAHANWREATGRLTSLEALRDELEFKIGSLGEPSISSANRRRRT
jgi:hypothetical protein